jgi:hypothetical protein
LHPEPVRPAPGHEEALALRLAFGDHGGRAVVVGEPPLALLAALAATASEIVLHARPAYLRAARRLVEAWTPAALRRAAAGEDEASAIALVWGGALGVDEAAEGALLSVGDGGRLLLSIARGDPRGPSIRRWLEAAAGGPVLPASWSDSRRDGFDARRRAVQEVQGPSAPGATLPVTVALLARDCGPTTETLLCDLLLRPALPPERLLIWDLSPRAGPGLPSSLYGLPARSPTRTSFLAARDGDPFRAFEEALRTAETPYLAVVEGEARCTPNHLAVLGLALEAHPTWGAAVAASAWLGADGEAIQAPRPEEGLEGPLSRFLAGGAPPLGSALFRTDRLRQLPRIDPKLGDGRFDDLWLRLAEAGPIGFLPLSTHALPPRGPRSFPSSLHPSALRAFLGRTPPSRIAAGLPGARARDRSGQARLLRGRALLRAGLAEEASNDFDLALEAMPGDPAARFGGALARIRSQGGAAARGLPGPGGDPEPESLLLEALAALAGPGEEAAAELVTRLLELRPGWAPAHLLRRWLARPGDPALADALWADLAILGREVSVHGFTFADWVARKEARPPA